MFRLYITCNVNSNKFLNLWKTIFSRLTKKYMVYLHKWRKRIVRIITQICDFRSFVISVQPSSNSSEETIHRTSRWQFVTPERGRWRSLTKGLYCWVSYMVRNSLSEFTPCFFSAVFLREGVEDRLLLFLSIADTVYSKPGPLSGVLINSAHSHLPSSNKRKMPIHIPCLIYPLHGTKVRLACKGKCMGRSLTLWSWSRCMSVRMYVWMRAYGRLRDVAVRRETHIIFTLADRSLMPLIHSARLNKATRRREPENKGTKIPARRR